MRIIGENNYFTRSKSLFNLFAKKMLNNNDYQHIDCDAQADLHRFPPSQPHQGKRPAKEVPAGLARPDEEIMAMIKDINARRNASLFQLQRMPVIARFLTIVCFCGFKYEMLALNRNC
jgi:hypothetical protein